MSPRAFTNAGRTWSSYILAAFSRSCVGMFTSLSTYQLACLLTTCTVALIERDFPSVRLVSKKES